MLYSIMQTKHPLEADEAAVMKGFISVMSQKLISHYSFGEKQIVGSHKFCDGNQLLGTTHIL